MIASRIADWTRCGVPIRRLLKTGTPAGQSGNTGDLGSSTGNNRTLLLLSLMALLGTGVTCLTDVQIELKRGIFEGFGQPVSVTIPDTVPVHTAASVVVMTYGGGCIFAKAFEQVSVEGLLAVVEPYDSVNVSCTVATAELRGFTHIAVVQFGEQGIATVRVVGQRVSADGTESLMTVERSIVVN
jgi:hypothetical protein